MAACLVDCRISIFDGIALFDPSMVHKQEPVLYRIVHQGQCATQNVVKLGGRTIFVQG